MDQFRNHLAQVINVRSYCHRPFVQKKNLLPFLQEGNGMVEEEDTCLVAFGLPGALNGPTDRQKQVRMKKLQNE